MPREVRPELLDELPADDPRAVRSRRDLRRVNAWMGHARLLARMVRENGGASAATILELGSGDGRLALSLARGVPFAHGAELVLLDRAPVVEVETLAAFAALGVHAHLVADEMRAFLSRDGRIFDLVLCNLVLHHFDDAPLAALFAAAARRARTIVALEPRRSLAGRLGSRMLGLIGCNGVTRHDARVSVAAGFRERELSALWPRDAGRVLREGPAGAFSHAFVARGSPA
ncbi:MAG: class I SAM-dependent methyltransferase [Planctomycetes bacterium]|nr:class I SAM-dependent methyltransferase [Planctomycetota bacterium]